MNPFHGLVLYCDGGSIGGNPGPSGGGLHGYFYRLGENPKQRIPDNIATTQGYLLKGQKTAKISAIIHEETTYQDVKDFIHSDKVYPVTVTEYIDGFAGNFTQGFKGTNNSAEIRGLILALKTILKHQAQSTLIFCDSQYTIVGFTKALAAWKKQNYLKNDGTEVSNRSLWELVDQLKEEIDENGYHVEMRWIKGHKGHLGNECSDKFAKLGAAKTSRHLIHIEDREETILLTEASNDYWKAEETPHPLLAETKRFLWNPKRHAIGLNDQGQYFYHLINLGDKQLNEHIGKNVSDSAYAVVHLNEPDQVIEGYKQIQLTHLKTHGYLEDITVVANLDELTDKKSYSDYLKYQEEVIIASRKHRPDIKRYDNKFVTEIMHPKFLSTRAVDALTRLNQMLVEKRESTLMQEDSLLIDFTGSLYEENFKVDKKTKETVSLGLKLKKEFSNGVTGFDLDLSSHLENKKIHLTFGMDLPRRNILKRIEGFQPKLELYLEKVDPLFYRYYIFLTLELTGERAVYCASHANTLFMFRK